MNDVAVDKLTRYPFTIPYQDLVPLRLGGIRQVVPTNFLTIRNNLNLDSARTNVLLKLHIVSCFIYFEKKFVR